MKRLTKTLFALSLLWAAAVGVSAAAADPVVITGKVKIPPGPVYLHDAYWSQPALNFGFAKPRVKKVRLMNRLPYLTARSLRW